MKADFLFAGPIGSGKSAVSREFARRIGAGWGGFGSVVRQIAIERGLPCSRQDLQVLGANLVATELSLLCERALLAACAGSFEQIVLDGLRHKSVFETIASLRKNSCVICIFIETSFDERLRRVAIRDGLDSAQLKELSLHPTERDVEMEIRRLSNYQADNNSSEVEPCVQGIVNWAIGHGYI